MILPIEVELYVNNKCICIISLFISPILDLNWRSNLVVKDRQQNPPSLTFARPKQNAKSLVVDRELLLCQYNSQMPCLITKYSSIIQISWHFYPPFTWIPMGLVAFPISWTAAR